MSTPPIDRGALRRALRHLPGSNHLELLHQALHRLDDDTITELFAPYVDVDTLRTDSAATPTLLDEIRTFERESLSGQYYEELPPGGWSTSQESAGTSAWIAECCHLFDRAVSATDLPHAEVRASLDHLIGLLERIDRFTDDIVYFPDEAGSWQIGIDWRRVIPRWTECLAHTAEPAAFAQEILRALNLAGEADRDRHLVTIDRLTDPAQREALQRAVAASHG